MSSAAAPTRLSGASPAAPVGDPAPYEAPPGPKRHAELDVPPAPLGLVALYDLWKKTTGTLSLDLKRRQFKGGAPGDSLWRLQPAAAGGGGEGTRGRRRGRPPARAQPTYFGQPPAPSGTYAAGGRGAYGGGYATGGGSGYAAGSGAGGDMFDLPSLSFMDTGARIKVMRHVQFGPKVEVARPGGGTRQVPTLDLGVGLSFELDTAELQPQARLRFRDLASLRALPFPALKISKRLAWPDSSWGVRLSYECPLEALTSFYRPPARLLLAIDNMYNNGVQLTQAGLEFNYRGEFFEGNTQLRAAGLVALPRELPLEPGQPFAGLEIKRLGLKASCAATVEANNNWGYRPRVRRELRSLSDREYKCFITGLSVMQTLSTASGRRLYGTKYISYDELIVKHAVATNDPRGDQGHNGPPFMTFHRAFLLELEESLLAVCPDMKALPYWDLTLDNPITGKFWNTPNAIMTEKYAGNQNGNALVGSGVITGVFAWRQVKRFIPQQWSPKILKVFNGSAYGLVRGPTNTNFNPLVTRYPTANLATIIKAVNQSGISRLPFANEVAVPFEANWLITQGGKLALFYPEKNYLRCLDPKTYPDWMSWGFCCDLTILMNAPSSVDKTKYINPVVKATALLHAGPHWTTGGMSLTDEKNIGDMFDVSTSPNEPLMFPIHHANLDRSNMLWQMKALQQDRTMLSKFWGYPKSKAEYSTAADGTLLNDVVNSVSPFDRLFSTPPANGFGYTHKEVLWYTRPGASPYIYDTMLPYLKQISG